MDFKPFPKLSRWSRDVVITEKLDGTNACVIIEEGGNIDGPATPMIKGGIFAQSRTRLITPEDDNFGFAKFVQDNADYLKATLGCGYHYGEWWGQGIQRKYGQNSKKFSLFNVHRWAELQNNEDAFKIGLGVVPTLWKGNMDLAHLNLDLCMQDLEKNGSKAAPGFMNPEGVVLYHTAGGYLFKKTFEKDQEGKGNVS